MLGGSKCEGVPYITELIEREIGKHVDDMLNERLLSILSTKENVNLQTLGFSEEAVKGYQAIITPIDIAGERLGTLFIYKKDKVYEIDDIILSEYGTTVVGLEMLRSVNEEKCRRNQKKSILYNRQSVHCRIRNWKQSFIYLMSWMVRKEFWSQVRLQTVSELPDRNCQCSEKIRKCGCDRIPFFRHERNVY